MRTTNNVSCARPVLEGDAVPHSVRNEACSFSGVPYAFLSQIWNRIITLIILKSSTSIFSLRSMCTSTVPEHDSRGKWDCWCVRLAYSRWMPIFVYLHVTVCIALYSHHVVFGHVPSSSLIQEMKEHGCGIDRPWVMYLYASLYKADNSYTVYLYATKAFSVGLGSHRDFF